MRARSRREINQVKTRIHPFGIAIVLAVIAAAGCDTAMDDPLLGPDGAPLEFPDGIDPRNPKVERVTIGVDVAGVQSLRIELPTGRVVVSPTPDGSATVKVTKHIIPDGRSAEEYQRLLEGSVVSAARSFVDPSRLDVVAAPIDGLPAEEIAFDIRIFVPASMGVEVVAANAPVEVSGLNGNVAIRTHNGAVEIENVVGHVMAQTSNRPVTARSVIGNLQAQTSNATVELSLTPPAGGQVSARTENGDIKLTIARTTKAELDLLANGGAVSASLSGFTVSDVVTGDGFLTGILNSGGGMIQAETTNGNIEFQGM
jgi:hypothetical protein